MAGNSTASVHGNCEEKSSYSEIFKSYYIRGSKMRVCTFCAHVLVPMQMHTAAFVVVLHCFCWWRQFSCGTMLIVYIAADLRIQVDRGRVVLCTEKLSDRKSMETHKLMLSVKNVCVLENAFKKAVHLFCTFSQPASLT